VAQIHLLVIAYLALDWAVRIAFIIGVSRGRLPSAARSWILFAIVLPIPAALLFLLIGNIREPAWRKSRFEAFEAQAWGPERPRPDLDMETGIARLIERLGGFGPSHATQVELISNYDQFVDQLINAIDCAASHVHLLAYIFADDQVARRIIDALNHAVRRGVTCRVLFDAAGSRPWRRGLEPLLDRAGVEWHAVAPASFSVGRYSRYDLRNHRKLYSVDGRIAFIGSQNLVAADFRKSFVNQELMAALTGAIVADIEHQFARDWYVETENKIAPALEPPSISGFNVQLCPTGPEFGVDGFPLVLAELLHMARSRIALTSPYLVPDEVLLSTLRAAVAKGVDVRVFVSQRIDQIAVGLAQRSYYAELMQMGVRLFAYREMLLHAKHVLVDDRLVYLGSGNADIRSFRLNSEIGVVFDDPKIASEFAGITAAYEAASDEIRPGEWDARSAFQKIGEGLFRLSSPLL
jgi:cardiolipin synthase A/B